MKVIISVSVIAYKSSIYHCRKVCVNFQSLAYYHPVLDVTPPVETTYYLREVQTIESLSIVAHGFVLHVSYIFS